MADPDDAQKSPASPVCYADEFPSEAGPTVRELVVAPAVLAAVRAQASAHDLGKVIVESLDVVYAHLRSVHVQHLGRNVVMYLSDALEVEIGVEVAGEFFPGGPIIRTSTPGGLAASTTHYGPYSTLSGAHTAVRRWCADRRRNTGIAWEVYGDWNDDPSHLRTDVFYQLLPAP